MLLLISGDPVEAPLSVRLVAAERWIRAQPEVLEGCLVIRAVALHLPQRRGAPTRLWTRARARGGSNGCSICAGTQMAGGDGPCRCRAPTRTRPTPTRKALPAARGVRPGCAWAYSAATITRHGSRAAILILGDSNWGRSFLLRFGHWQFTIEIWPAIDFSYDPRDQVKITFLMYLRPPAGSVRVARGG